MSGARFIGWLLPKHELIYDGDPLVTIEKLFPLDELLDLVGHSDRSGLSETDAQSVQWFIELMGKRKAIAAPDKHTAS